MQTILEKYGIKEDELDTILGKDRYYTKRETVRRRLSWKNHPSPIQRLHIKYTNRSGRETSEAYAKHNKNIDIVDKCQKGNCEDLDRVVKSK